MTVVQGALDQETIDALKLEQKKLSRRIGEAKKQGDDPAPLLSDIQEISAKIKALESAQKVTAKRESTAAKVASRASEADPERFAWAPIWSREDAADTAARVCGKEFTVEYWPFSREEDHEIEAYLAEHPGSTPYHRPCVVRAINQCFQHACCYLVAKAQQASGDASASRVVGVLPVIQLKSKLFGNYCVSMPFFNYGGVLANSTQIAEKLLAEAKRWAVAREARHVEYRYVSDPPLALPKKSDKVSFFLDLPDSAQALRQGFKSKLRSQIKKAESYAHTVRHGGIELVDDFYRVFSENMRDLGTPVYSKNFFRSLCEALGEAMNICVVYYGDEPAAAAVLIGHKKRLEIPWASTVRRHNPKSVNMLLYWQVLCWAIAQGYQCFDFGRCSRDAGTYKFKAQWGATELPLYWHYQLLSGEMPALNTKNKKFLVLIAVWKRLPVWFANLVGPHIVKYLP